MDIEEEIAEQKRASIKRQQQLLNLENPNETTFIKADFFDPGNAKDLCNNEKFHHIL